MDRELLDLEGSMIDQLGLDLPAKYEYLSLVPACIQTILESVKGIANREALTHEVELAVHETCINIVGHAYRGSQGRIQISIALWENPGRIIVDLQDTGQSFDMPDIKPPKVEEYQTNGYGLFLIQELLDQVIYTKEAGMNHWRLIKNISLE